MSAADDLHMTNYYDDPNCGTPRYGYVDVDSGTGGSNGFG